MKKRSLYGEIALVIALILNSFASSLLVKANLGITTLSSLPLVLSKIYTVLSYGMWNFVFQSFVLLILMVLTKKKLGDVIISLIQAFIFGKLIDLFLWALESSSETIIARIIYFTSGFTFITFGAALFIVCTYPILPFDSFVRDISLHFGINVRKVRTVFDFGCVFSSLGLSILALNRIEGIGIGTIVMMLLAGTLTQFWLSVLNKRFKIIRIGAK